jgi:hypothetical protein
MPPLELVEEELCVVAIAPPVVPVQEEEVQIHVEGEFSSYDLGSS